jgi:hypothetical protein
MNGCLIGKNSVGGKTAQQNPEKVKNCSIRGIRERAIRPIRFGRWKNFS